MMSSYLTTILLCFLSYISHTLLSVSVSALSTQGQGNHHQQSRRTLLSRVITAGSCGWLAGSSSSRTGAAPQQENEELPYFLRDYTKLAPLGAKTISSSDQKSLGLSLDDLAGRLTKDLTVGSTGQGGYFLTGDISRDIFRDDATFIDPTNRVSSLSQYQQALRIIFDPAHSTVELVRPLLADASTRTITGRIRSRGYLQLPWKPYVTAYESTIVYTVDESGLIARQDQTWSKAASKALQESFTPSWVDPPVRSTRTASSSEPRSVTRLFEILNGRRPYEYSKEEREEMDQLVETIIGITAIATENDSSKGKTNGEFDRSLFPGTWMLAYIQPGPNGATIDRRIPFPEFDFNDNFQVFGKDNTVVNVGQVLGPSVVVKVFGTIQEGDPQSTRVPKRFRANIEIGQLCAFGNICIGLPIHGEGLFDSLYLGDRLRIGQNLNGGGARVVQIRLDDSVAL